MKPTPSLATYIEAEIIPRYDSFDRAHDRRHVRSVIDRSLTLARELGADPDMAYTVAAYHDTGLVAGRERHHTVSGEILAADTALRRWFDEEQIAAMRCAVEDHRASAKEPPRNLYGRIVAEADRLIEPLVILRRTLQYGLAHCPELDRAEQYARCRAHLHEKYGEGGLPPPLAPRYGKRPRARTAAPPARRRGSAPHALRAALRRGVGTLSRPLRNFHPEPVHPEASEAAASGRQQGVDPRLPDPRRPDPRRPSPQRPTLPRRKSCPAADAV